MRLEFENGYGVSVIDMGSLKELAVLHNGRLCYDTPIADDVIGYLTDDEVSEIIEEVKLLKPRK